VVFNENGEIRREMLLTELRQRIRYVQQGPDELLYILTDENDGALLRIEPSTLEEFNQWSVSAGHAVSATQPQAPDPVNELPLFASQDCRACHSTNTNQIGPAYINIAERYEATESNLDFLVMRIIEGGEGEWGETPMTPHPALDRRVAREMAIQILGLETE
jgi:cytochrome c551/c552